MKGVGTRDIIVKRYVQLLGPSSVTFRSLQRRWHSLPRNTVCTLTYMSFIQTQTTPLTANLNADNFSQSSTNSNKMSLPNAVHYMRNKMILK